MYKELSEKVPTTKDELLGITGYTLAIFEKYRGEDLLKIFKHYYPLLKEERARAEAEKERVRRDKLEKLEAKNKAKTSAQSNASKKNSKTYGILDDAEIEGNIDYNPDAVFVGNGFKSGGASGGFKRKATGGFSKSGKKTKYNGNSSGYFKGGNSSGGGGAKKPFKKWKNWKPKNK